MLALPFLTMLITLANSGGFVFLVADERLSQYIVCTSIFSVLTWTTHWIIPSAFNFRLDAISDIRLMQYFTVAVGTLILNISAPSSISLAFSLLLVLEVFFFQPALLVMYSMTAIFHVLEIVRGVLNVLNLVACIFIFDGSPSFLVLGLALTVSLTGVLSWRFGNRLSMVFPRSLSRSAFERIGFAIVTSRNTRFMIAARVLEISAIVLLTSLNSLSSVIAVKLAVLIGQAASLNSRKANLAILMALASSMLIAIISGVIVFNSAWPVSLSPALQTLTWHSLAVAVLFQLPFVSLLFHSIVISKRVRSAD